MSRRLDALFGEREELAFQIHESYVAFKGAGKTPQGCKQEENCRAWGELKQTYRLACRRAADHFPIKCYGICTGYEDVGEEGLPLRLTFVFVF